LSKQKRRKHKVSPKTSKSQTQSFLFFRSIILTFSNPNLLFFIPLFLFQEKKKQPKKRLTFVSLFFFFFFIFVQHLQIQSCLLLSHQKRRLFFLLSQVYWKKSFINQLSENPRIWFDPPSQIFLTNYSPLFFSQEIQKKTTHHVQIFMGTTPIIT